MPVAADSCASAYPLYPSSNYKYVHDSTESSKFKRGSAHQLLSSLTPLSPLELEERIPIMLFAKPFLFVAALFSIVTAAPAPAGIPNLDPRHRHTRNIKHHHMERIINYRHEHRNLTYHQTHYLEKLEHFIINHEWKNLTLPIIRHDCELLFGAALAKYILTGKSSYQNQHYSRAIDGITATEQQIDSCGCSASDDYCDSGYKCSPQAAACSYNADGCGTLGLYTCDGACSSFI